MKTHVLIVEDERSIKDNIEYALGSEGYSTAWAASGADALAELEQANFALIVLDIGLPDTDGFELCKAIRKKSNIPIVMLTARSEEVDRIVGLEIGADDYITKPFSPRELTARIKAILRRVSPVAEGAAIPFEVDENRNSIKYFGQVLKLSRYEFRILQILTEKPGWVYSREQLMELAWEGVDDSLERTVDTHVKTLRAKLKAIDPEIEAIVTHRSVGYSLKETW